MLSTLRGIAAITVSATVISSSISDSDRMVIINGCF